MKNLISFVLMLQSIYFYGQIIPMTNEEFEPYLVSVKSGNLAYSIDSIHKGYIKKEKKNPIDKMHVKEKTDNFNASKITLYTHNPISFYSYNDSILLEYYDNDKIKQFLRYNNKIGIDTIEYRLYDENGLLLTEHYRYYDLMCGFGYPYDEDRTFYSYDVNGTLIHTLKQIKWNYEVETKPFNIWVNTLESDYIYEDNKIKKEITKSNFISEVQDSVLMILYPYRNVNYSYEAGKLKEVLKETWYIYAKEWNSVKDIYAYINDTISVETHIWDKNNQKWNPYSKQLKSLYYGKENIINQFWINNKWAISNRKYYQKSSIDTFFNYYDELWDSNQNSWTTGFKSEFERINDTIINLLYYSKGYTNKYKYLYDDKGRIVLKQKYQENISGWKKTEELQNIFNENDLLEKSIMTSYYSYNYDTISTYIEYFWKTDILNSNKEISRNKEISVYPNPAHSNINIDFDGEIEKLAIYDINSRLVSIDDKPRNIDISSLNVGIYFVRIITKEGEILTNKFCKLSR